MSSGLLRIRHGHDHHRVTFVELFFDLVFVFAVTQLSHLLLHHLTWVGLLETAMLLSGVWTAWISTSWATNWLDPERTPVRLALFAGMLAGLVMSAAIPEAFLSRGPGFALPLVVLQLGRCCFLLYAMRADQAGVRNHQRILSWLVISSLLWISGGLVEGGARIGLWLAALVVDGIGPAMRYWTPYLGRSAVSDWNIDGGHMAERCGLFVIIALGESILVSGATFAGLEWTTNVVIAFVASFLGSVAMWWIYFNATAVAGSARIAAATDPGRLARSAYTYVHLIIVAGIIVSAVADELVLVHPDGHAEPATVATLVGGPALYLAGIMLFKMTLGRALRWRFLGIMIASLAALVALASILSPLALGCLTALVLIVVAAVDVIAAPAGAVAAKET